MSVSPPLDGLDRPVPVDPTLRDNCPQRLRLHHLFVLTAVMAVLLALNGPQRDFANPSFEPRPALRALWLVTGITHTIMSAAALTALGYGIAGYRRGLRFFDQPGHWLLAEISLTALFSIVPSVAYRSIGSSKQLPMGDNQMTILFVLMGYSLLVLVLGRIALNLYFGKTKCIEREWKRVFYAKALAAILFGLGDLIIVAMMVSAVRADGRQQVTRDVSHWCGVSLQLALSSLTLVSIFSMVFNMIAFLHA